MKSLIGFSKETVTSDIIFCFRFHIKSILTNSWKSVQYKIRQIGEILNSVITLNLFKGRVLSEPSLSLARHELELVSINLLLLIPL